MSIEAMKKKIAEMERINREIDSRVFSRFDQLIRESIFKAITSSTSIAAAESSKSMHVHTTILKILTPDAVMSRIDYDAEPSSLKEFEGIYTESMDLLQSNIGRTSYNSIFQA